MELPPPTVALPAAAPSKPAVRGDDGDQRGARRGTEIVGDRVPEAVVADEPGGRRVGARPGGVQVAVPWLGPMSFATVPELDWSFASTFVVTGVPALVTISSGVGVGGFWRWSSP